ncbi:ketopantoate reductase family protein [Pseudomonas viridiflava]|uniref:ketopantoate reductase family protein n=1 Tax=Pseudomonas viridiflava TaxID=33069 RepID=UPI002A6B86C4|nr:ketopantoate reductase family protein [Pseudomonas viridiflava]MDY0935395.1 ketopantoate reductase family protein [Pseudomonas viridiflava]MDY1011713.1 ketopantoate reductase family protein [Pseudomonas viridiflava]
MRILIVGAGAVGGYFGGRLLEAGRQVSFLVRPGRAEELDRDGLVVRSPQGNFQYPSPPYMLANRLADPFDLILLSCKAFDLDAAMDAFEPAVGPDTSILSLLNGMAHLGRLTERFGKDAVLGGQCLISVDRDSTGAILHLNEMHQLSFGELSGALTPRILRVAEALADAGFEANLSQHIVQAMWDKWCFIATLAAITASMRASIGDVLDAGGEGLILKALSECAAIALAAGYPPDAKVRQRQLELLTARGSTLTASMMRDIERGAPTEVEQILGDMLIRRNALGVASNELSVLDVACTHVRAYEARRIREQP